jgi:hypothetical protein
MLVINALDGNSVLDVLARNQREIVALFQSRKRIHRAGMK